MDLHYNRLNGFVLLRLQIVENNSKPIDRLRSMRAKEPTGQLTKPSPEERDEKNGMAWGQTVTAAATLENADIKNIK